MIGSLVGLGILLVHGILTLASCFRCVCQALRIAGAGPAKRRKGQDPVEDDDAGNENADAETDGGNTATGKKSVEDMHAKFKDRMVVLQSNPVCSDPEVSKILTRADEIMQQLLVQEEPGESFDALFELMSLQDGKKLQQANLPKARGNADVVGSALAKALLPQETTMLDNKKKVAMQAIGLLSYVIHAAYYVKYVNSGGYQKFDTDLQRWVTKKATKEAVAQAVASVANATPPPPPRRFGTWI